MRRKARETIDEHHRNSKAASDHVCDDRIDRVRSEGQRTTSAPFGHALAAEANGLIDAQHPGHVGRFLNLRDTNAECAIALLPRRV
jgi:hypothetical protein